MNGQSVCVGRRFQGRCWVRNHFCVCRGPMCQLCMYLIVNLHRWASPGRQTSCSNSINHVFMWWLPELLHESALKMPLWRKITFKQSWKVSAFTRNFLLFVKKKHMNKSQMAGFWKCGALHQTCCSLPCPMQGLAPAWSRATSPEQGQPERWQSTARLGIQPRCQRAREEGEQEVFKLQMP